MKTYCFKCKRNLDSKKGDIINIVPVFFEDAILEFHLCRPHAIESDNMNATEFRKWIHKKEVST